MGSAIPVGALTCCRDRPVAGCGLVVVGSAVNVLIDLLKLAEQAGESDQQIAQAREAAAQPASGGANA